MQYISTVCKALFAHFCPAVVLCGLCVRVFCIHRDAEPQFLIDSLLNSDLFGILYTGLCLPHSVFRSHPGTASGSRATKEGAICSHKFPAT